MTQKQKVKKEWEKDEKEARKNDLREKRKQKNDRLEFFLTLEKEN